MEAADWPNVEDIENLDTWPTKQEAMQHLRMSEKTLERRISDGKVRKRERFVPGRKPLPILHPQDLRDLQQQTLVPVAVPRAVQTMPTVTPPQTDISPIPAVTAFLTAFERNPERFFPPSLPVTPPSKPFLTIAEAAKYSGLPEEYLRRQIASGGIKAIKTNPSPKVNRWLIRWDWLWRHETA